MLKFVDEFKQYLFEESHDWGDHYLFRFQNNYGASVIKNPGSYGNTFGLWEMALIFFDENSFYHLSYDRDFYNDVKGFLSVNDVIRLLNKIKQY